MPAESTQFNAESDFSRLDVCIAEKLPDLTRSGVKKLIEEGRVELRGEKCLKAGEKVKCGDRISVEIPPLKTLSLAPSQKRVDIVYQDADMAVIDKPQGMVVHPAPGAYEDTLVNVLIASLDSLSGINGVMRPGIVHRLDKDTSGLLVVAKNDNAHVRKHGPHGACAVIIAAVDIKALRFPRFACVPR